MIGGELTAAQIRSLLHELGRHLQAAGAHGDVKLVGGAALILQGIGNRPTADIDASYADWLNTNAAAFVPDIATWVLNNSTNSPSRPQTPKRSWP